MKAVVLRAPCRAEELALEDVPIPEEKPGWVLVKVKAFGINRSEIFTRQGDSPSVKLPRIIGIECVGEVADPGDSGLAKGQRVMSMMGGLGRTFDGSYAEYTSIPKEQVYPVNSDLPWEEFAAIPEMYYTAWCSLTEALRLTKRDILLIRGGTSSVGLASIQIAHAMGTTVAATSRNPQKRALLERYGADIVLTDDETLPQQSRDKLLGKATKILELIGTKTMASSFGMLRKGGILCMSGILGGEWEFPRFAPMDFIPSGSYLTIYDSQEISRQSITEMFDFLTVHHVKPPVAKVLPFEKVAEAHRLMESNTAGGKIIISVS